MLAYHNEPQLKAGALERMRQHRAADELLRGKYWSLGRGCAVGCLLHDVDGGHERYEAEFGIPVALAHLEDTLFEHLPENHLDWPVAFLGAIPVGADLAGVWPALVRELIFDPVHSLVALDPEVASWRAHLETMLAGGTPSGLRAGALAGTASVWTAFWLVRSLATDGMPSRWCENGFYRLREFFLDLNRTRPGVSQEFYRWLAARTLQLLAAAPVPGAVARISHGGDPCPTPATPSAAASAASRSF